MTSKWLMKQKMLNEQEVPEQPEEELSMEEVEKIERESSKDSDPDRLYTWMLGDNIWQVARRLKFDPIALLEHNDIDPKTYGHDIAPGDQLHLPEPRPKDLRVPTKYEMFEVPRIMHVTHEGGTHKVVFGNATKWEDIRPTGGLYRQGRNVKIEGVAYVPIGDDTATFYMDHVALGEFETTGKVTYTIGFIHTHLKEGEAPIEAPKPVPKPNIKKVEEQIAQDVAFEDTRYPTKYKASFRSFNPDRKPLLFTVNKTIQVDELDTRRPSRTLEGGATVSLIGTFTKDGVVYGRPANTEYWFGIPMKYVSSIDDDEDDEVYNYDVPLPDRVAMGSHGRLSPMERYIVIPSLKVGSYYVRLRDWAQNKQNKEK